MKKAERELQRFVEQRGFVLLGQRKRGLFEVQHKASGDTLLCRAPADHHARSHALLDYRLKTGISQPK